MQSTRAEREFKFWQLMLKHVLANKQRRRSRPSTSLQRTYKVPEADLNQD